MILISKFDKDILRGMLPQTCFTRTRRKHYLDESALALEALRNLRLGGAADRNVSRD